MTRPFVFLPGAGGHGSFWDPVRERLVATGVAAADSVSFDWPGFDGVPPVDGVRSYEDLATLVIDALDGPTVVVAQSMGGVVATMVAHRRPNLVSHLVLAVTSAGVDMKRLGAIDWRPASRAANPNNPRWMWGPAPHLTRELSALPMRTLLVWATDDEISPLAVGRHLKGLLRARLVTFESDDHWVARVHAAEVAEHIADLVRPRLGFLHTARAHVAAFDALVGSTSGSGEIAAGEVATLHVVREDLLAEARRLGATDPLVRAHVGEALERLWRSGADMVVCTCSTIGGVAETIGASGMFGHILRVDRPMAAAAVATGERIAVVAALESTIGPTMALLGEEAVAQGRAPVVEAHPCFEAWEFWERDDVEGYHDAVARHVDALDKSWDTVVLAQASMHGALPLVSSRSTRRVLVSPQLAVDTARSMLA